MQMRLYLKYKKLMRGIEQPELDGFSSTCMADIIRRHRPGLALMHLTAFDSLGHRYGEEREDEALKVLDESFGRILDALGENARVILFSDHAQLSTHTSIIANDLLFNMGLIGKDNQGEYRAGESGSFIECSGGSAFFHAGTLNNTEKEKVKEAIAKNEGFKRWLKDDEMAEAGMDTDDIAAGFCAKEGYEYADYPRDEKAQHGYPLDYPGYKVFYALEGPGIKAETIKGGSLLDIAPLAKKILGIQ
jgi:predicted AlkP superfamily pyrophosphatase or phosphodiesterase